MTRSELHAHAERLGIPRRTLAQVKDLFAKCEKKNKRKAISQANLLLNHGRLEDDAMAYVREYLA